MTTSTSINYTRLISDNCSIEAVELEKRERKVRRALARFYAGKKLTGDYLLVTLTTAPNLETDLNKVWRKFVSRLARRGIPRAYFAVREYNKDGTCEHLHVVFRVSYLSAETVRKQWSEAIGMRADTPSGLYWVHLDRVYSSKGMARYLAKYITKGMNQRKRAFWYGYEWVWKGFVGDTWIAYRLDIEMALDKQAMAVLSSSERKVAMMVLLIYAEWEHRKGGFLMPWSKRLYKQACKYGINYRRFMA